MELEIEKGDSEAYPHSPGPNLESTSNLRAKTSLRLKYEAESQMILKKFGGLKGIQSRLGLNQRKICQLLMVDPSSWSRWMLAESKTPPHILRACEWYLALQDKYPGFDVNFWLHSSGKYTSATLEKTELLQQNLRSESSSLKIQVESLEEQILKLQQKLEVSFSNSSHKTSPLKRTYFLVGVFVGANILFLIYFLMK